MSNETNAAEENEFFTEEGFDFNAIFNQTAFPKDEVTVYLNEALAYKIRVSKELLKGEDNNDELKKLAKVIRGYEEDLEKSRLKFSITGVDKEVIAQVGDRVQAKFKDRYKRRGKAGNKSGPKELSPEDAKAYSKYFNAAIYQLYIEKVEQSNGTAQTPPTVEFVKEFIDKAPDAAVEKFIKAISALKVSTEEFEARLDETFFLKS